ncbi:sulfatase-like hydrolase/transferase [Aromatoleum anaerobium]|uniref:Sulfatase-like hydrolase/transferase n=1 Tax=Aromatoleum anaerobium TaxID=182180 RepID=A0ABX1PFG2_9RHOO|nr:sulfatase-like hydrolase/transferase [Aromatoleum anaerobium]MCK0509210.1 sulfatase-like hydrolase/transferase [Aromatoleum anaerobium]
MPDGSAAADPAASLTVLICTHNRVELLSRVIASLNAAQRPLDTRVRLFVVANACTDGTHEFLAQYSETNEMSHSLPLEWIAEPTPGKSQALNRALPMLSDSLIAFVDDDHRVDSGYLKSIVDAARAWPEAGLICGRILPDWDGTEPPWVHDDGPYRIYPLPVPRYDQGDKPMRVDLDGGIPGGGNLVVRLGVVRTTGPFLTELGPTGHDLGGSEDVEWIRRTLRNGAVLHYAPQIVQYHYVDGERLKFSYLIRKGFHRSKSVMRFRHAEGGVPLYMWRKVGGYALRSGLALDAQARRFYLVRLASSLGEMSGMYEAGLRRGRRTRLSRLPSQNQLGLAAALGAGGFALAGLLAGQRFDDAVMPAIGVALVLSIALMLKSMLDFSQTGPRMRDEITRRYRFHVPFAMARLGFWTFAVGLFFALPGSLLAVAAADALVVRDNSYFTTVAAALSLALATGYVVCHTLIHNPGLIVASWQYRGARLHRVWGLLSVRGLRWTAIIGVGGVSLLCGLLAASLAIGDAARMATALLCMMVGYLGVLAFALKEPDSPVPAPRRNGAPNVLMIGSDTLRADRVGAQRNGQPLTPNIDALARLGTRFGACYVPCARTAPSLISLLTGTWPHTHGIRDNFVPDEETKLDLPALPSILGALGYRTAAVSDWCGADLGKFSLGFDILDLPDDQWNLKYLIRQGPKDIRLFLSLFLHNRIGRLLLPELYYLGGVPQTEQLGRRGRRMISRLAATGEPFLLNLFYSTTHPPFASEFPYYVRHANPAYAGESKFAMARLTEPFEIIRRQGEPREEFDLDQILDLYDGCVAQFDDEVGRTMRHLEASGLTENTIVVLYSDHGMEFFEHGTWGQGNSALGDFSARIPLIIADPRQPGGQRVDQVVRTIDLVPTLLELLQAPSVKCDGSSLVPAMLDPAFDLKLKAYNETGIWITPVPGLPPRHLSYPDLLQLLDVPDDASGTLAIKSEYHDIVLLAKDRMVRDGRWKLVYQPLESGMLLALYDVEADPGCTRDLAEDHPMEVARLWAELRKWMEKDPVLRRHGHAT